MRFSCSVLASVLFVFVALVPTPSTCIHIHRHVRNLEARTHGLITTDIDATIQTEVGVYNMPPPKGQTKVMNHDFITKLKIDSSKLPTRPSLIETSSDVDVDVAVTVTAPKHDTNPLLKLGKATAFKSVTDARKGLRGADPKSLTLNGFSYNLFTDGSVNYAYGFITNPYAVRPAELGDNAYYICDTTYSHDNADAQRDRDDWHSGHIIAAALNGDNNDPLNFFPHYKRSNSAGGLWWRLEVLIGWAQHKFIEQKAKITTANILKGKDCQIFIVPEFQYATATEFVPYGGYYRIEVETSCGDFYMTKFSSSTDGYILPFAQMLNEVKATQVDVFEEAGISGIKGYSMSYGWKNAYDKADRAVNPELFKKK